MIINALLEKEKMSRYRLSKESGVAMTTITVSVVEKQTLINARQELCIKSPGCLM